MTKRLLLVAALIVVAASVAAYWKFVYFPRTHPNVVVVMIDTLRADHLPMYGYSRMTAPHLTEWAKQAVVFDAWSPTSWTKSAVASILTGLHPVRHQSYGRSDVVSPDVKMLAEVLGEHGYHTVGFTSNIWTSKAFGFDRGFDSYTTVQAGPSAPKGGADGSQVNSVVFQQLQHLKCPCFVFVHYVDPHLPYRPSRAWDGSSLSAEDASGLQPEQLRTAEFLHRPVALLNRAIDLYDGEIRQTDDNVSALMGFLDRKGITKNAIVVVTADHGEEFEEHGRMSHGQSLYEEVLRVPLLISAPGVVPGRAKGRASLMDIFPTILDIVGIQPLNVDGTSLRPNMASRQPIAQRDFLSHLDYQDSPIEAKGLRASYTALGYTHGNDKLILSKSPFAKELFDLAADAHEQHNRFEPDPEKTRRIATLLSEKYNEESRRRGRRVTIVARDETKQAIRALGYLAGPGANELRSIAGGIRPADSDPEGDLGWTKLEPCIDLSDARDESQLLEGWYGAEPNGRWTAKRAGILLPLDDPSLHMVTIMGNNGRPDSFDVSVSMRNAVVSTQRVAPGNFELEVALPQERPSTVLKLTTSSTFRPSEHGSPDPRELGIKVARICAH